MAWDRRLSAALGALALGAAAAACNGAAFSAKGDSGGGGGSSAAGKGSEPSPEGGQGDSGGSSSAGKGTVTGGMSGNGSSGGRGGSAGNAGTDQGMAGDGNTVDPIPAIPTQGLVYWFKSNEGANLDGAVAQWLDQSGNHFDAVQIQGPLQPKLVTTNQPDLPLVVFDGDDDFLELPELKVDMTQGLSFFAVAGQSHVHECSPFIELSNGSEINDINFGTLGQSFQYEIDQQVLYGEPDIFPVNTIRLFEVQHSHDTDQDVGEIRMNGALISSMVMSLPPNVLRVSNFIGKSLYLNCPTYPGGMGELILYKRKLAPDERAAVLAYLSEKWMCCK